MKFFDRFKNKKKNIPSGEEEQRVKEEAFLIIEKLKKSASIARIGGFRPTNEKFRSRFSGEFLMKENEDWPKWNERYLDSIIQVNISELPFVPKIIEEYKLITIFIDTQNVPFDQPIGKGWEMRFYKDLDNLVRKSNPNGESKLKSFEINWELRDNESPSFEDAESEVDLSLFNEMKNSADLFYGKFSHHEFTKIGGWPSIIQHQLEMDSNNMIFQIGTENKVNLNWIDGGNVFIGYENKEWKFECQFY